MVTYKRLTRQITAYISIALMISQPVIAAGIVVDGNADSANQAEVTSTSQGVPLVNIAAPSSSGLSHNKFDEYSVDENNLILNNATSSVSTVISGQIDANPNFNGSSATLILNEVTGSNQSMLNGYTEIGGDEAELIVANPNGITCSGCGFINTPHATLTTGTPILSNGQLQSFSINSGNISIAGDGLNAGNVDQLDLISRSLEVDAPLLARDLNLITGLNDVTFQDLRVTVRENSKDGTPLFAIDASSLGGMYANQIQLIATEQGVGVSLDGSMATDTGDVTLSADGSISLNNVVAEQNVAIESVSGDVSVSQLVYGEAVEISAAESMTNTGTVASLNGLSITASDLDNSGYVVGGLNKDSTLNASQSVTIDADTVTNTGSVFATEDLNVSSDSITSQNGTMEAIAGDLNLNVSGSIDNDSAQMVAGNNINLTTDNFVGTEDHGFNAGNSLVVNATNFSNTVEFETDSNLELNLANNFSNEGTVEATGNITVTAAEAENIAMGTVAASGVTNIEASGDVINLGSVTGGTGVELSGENILNKGVVASGGTLTVTAVNDFINSNADENDYPISLYDSNDEGYIPIGGEEGTILFSVADMSIYSDNFLNQYAEVYTFGNLTIAEDSGLNSATSFLNSSSTVQAYGDIDIYADEVKNYRDPVVDIDISAIQDMCSSFGDDIPEFCIRTIVGGDDYGIPSGTQLSEAWLYSELASLWYVGDEFSQQDYEISQGMLEQLYLAALYTPAIQSGSNISISGTDVVNSAGVISAENNIEINASNFTNESVAAATPGSSYSDESSWYSRSYYLGPLFGMDTIYYEQEDGTWVESNRLDLLDNLWYGDLDPSTDDYSDFPDDPDSSALYEPLQYILLNASTEFLWDVDDVASIVILSDGTVNVRPQDISANLLIDENNDLFLLEDAPSWDNPYIVEDEDYDTTEEILSYVSTYISFNDEAGYYELTLGSEVYPMVPDEDGILVAQFNPDNMPVEFKVQDAIEGYTTTAESNVVYPNDWSQESAIINTTFLPGEIQAGGTLTINATNSFTNGLDVEGVYQELDTPNVSVPAVDVDSNTSNAESAILDLEDNSDTFNDLYNSEPTSDDFDYEVVEVDTSIPDACGLFCETDGGGEYLVATNASVSQFIESYGSDYLLEQLNYEPEADVKRLGDSFYESYLISDAIMSQTGSRFISSDLHSDASQMKYLMDNAIAAQESMQLSIGVRLTDSQVAALTHDMMWLEEQEIDGQTVLVPVLYLAQVTENDISPSGGIVGRSVEINTDWFKNTGSIISESFVSLDVENELKNNGKIISGSDTQIQAGNITNNSTISSGGDLTVDTGSLKLNENSSLSSAGSADIEASSVLLNSGNLYVGGSLGLTADYSVAVQDSVITSESSMAIEASAGDLSFANTTLDTGDDLSLSSGNDFSNDSTMSVTGDLNVTARNISNTGEMAAGENLNLTAQNDITNTAATLTAGEDMNLNAGGDVVFDYSTTTVTTKKTPEKTTSIFGLNLSSQAKTTTEEVVIGTTVSAGNNLNINAGENIDITASDINAGGSATLIAEKDITLDAVSTESKTGTSKDYQTSLVYTGSSISAGDDLTLSAGEDLTVMSSDVSAADDVILAADGDVEIGAYQNEYYSYYYKKKSGWFSSKTTIKETFDTENVASTVAAGGNLTVNSAIADDGSILTGNDSGSVNVSGSTLTAGEQMVVYGDDVSVTNQKEIDYDYSKTKKSSWFGLSKSSDTDTKYQEMIAQSKLEAEEDMSLLSSGGVKVIGSDVVSGGDLNIVASGDVEIVADQAVSTQESSHSDSSFSIDPTKIYEANENSSFTSETTTTASSLTSDGDINLDASRITVAGSDISSANDINATADVGDIEIVSVEEAHASDHYEESMSFGITSVGDMLGEAWDSITKEGQLNVTLLEGEYNSSDADADSTTVASSSLNAGNDINLNAASDVEIIGSNVSADVDGNYSGDINIDAGDDVVIAESYATNESTVTEVEGTAELSLTVTNQYVEVAKAADELLEAEEQLEQVNEDYRQYQKDLDQLEERLTELQADYDNGVPGISYGHIEELNQLISDLEGDQAIYQAGIALASATVVSKTTLLAQQTAAAAQSTGTYGMDVGVQLEIDATETTTQTASNSAVGSTLSGSNININTESANNQEGETDSVSVQGSALYASNEINVNTDELSVTASQSSYQSSSDTSQTSVTASTSVYNSTSGANGLGGLMDAPTVSGSASESEQSSQTQTNSALYASELNVNTTGDAAFEGATVVANDEVNLSVGGDLTVASVQNTNAAESTNTSASYGIGGSGVNGSYSSGDSEQSATETVVTSITGGTVNIDVEGNTHLAGSTVSATDSDGNDNGQLSLTTDTLTVEHLDDSSVATNQSIGANSSINEGTGVGTTGIQFGTGTSVEQSVTLATLGEGSITVNSDAESGEDSTADLNRDIESTELELYSTDTGTEVDATIDTRLLTEQGRDQIAEDLLRSSMFVNAVEQIIETEKLKVTDFVSEVEKQSDIYDAVKAQIASDPELAAKLQDDNLDPESKESMLNQITDSVMVALGYETYDNNIIASAEKTEEGNYYKGYYEAATEDESGEAYINDPLHNSTEELIETTGHELAHAMDDAEGITMSESENSYADNMGENLANYVDSALDISGYDEGMADTNNMNGTATSESVKQNTQQFEALDKTDEEVGDAASTIAVNPTPTGVITLFGEAVWNSASDIGEVITGQSWEDAVLALSNKLGVSSENAQYILGSNYLKLTGMDGDAAEMAMAAVLGVEVSSQTTAATSQTSNEAYSREDVQNILDGLPNLIENGGGSYTALSEDTKLDLAVASGLITEADRDVYFGRVDTTVGFVGLDGGMITDVPGYTPEGIETELEGYTPVGLDQTIGGYEPQSIDGELPPSEDQSDILDGLGVLGGSAVYEPTLEDLALLKSDSQELSDNLIESGEVRPDECAAHHICAVNAKLAEESRAKLAEFGIDINDAVNGVFLPANSNSVNPNGSAIHSKVHTNEYYDTVNSMLQEADSREEVIEVLNVISESLKNGGL